MRVTAVSCFRAHPRPRVPGVSEPAVHFSGPDRRVAGLVKFPDEPSATVIQVMTGSVEEFPDGGGLFIEQAASAYLSAGSRHVRRLAAAPSPRR